MLAEKQKSACVFKRNGILSRLDFFNNNTENSMFISNLCVKRKFGTVADASTKGHKLSVKGGYIHQTFQGGYTLSPLGYKVCRNIEQIIREEMNKIGGQEILMPVVSGADIWKESGRYDKVDVLAKFKGRGGADYVLNPTHEEVVVDFVKSVLDSYKQLPFMVYQIQTKFRDELRSRAGLIRTREFRMKDAYSFHETYEDLEQYYNRCLEAYYRIFKRIGMKNVVDVKSDNGDMGGSISHEFMLLHEVGEDTVYVCPCGFRANRETMGDSKVCPVCGKPLEEHRGIEIGNIFQLGDKYSKSMHLEYTAADGTKKNPIMGCYGIGIGRAMASVIEESADDNGPIWNLEIAPYKVHIITMPDKTGESNEIALKLHNFLEENGVEVMLDNRDLRAGEKFADADLLGSPIRVIVSPKNIEKGVVEMKYRHPDLQGKPEEVAIGEMGRILEMVRLGAC
jgi:prolyl-tRNA synthetase